MAKTTKKPPEKRSRISQSDVPAYSLDDALRIPNALSENYASSPTKPLNVAAALQMSPTSSAFKMLAGASIAYELTSGGYNAAEISLTDLGRRVTSPLEEGDDVVAKREALLKPRVVGEFLRKYNNSPLPPKHIAENVLVAMDVPKERTAGVFDLILEGAEKLGLLQEIKNKKYVNLELPPVAGETFGGGDQDTLADDELLKEEPKVTPSQPEEKSVFDTKQRRVFITHGKNKEFVEPIKKLLAFGELEAVVSVEKQTVSQPVPEKVMNDMRSCGAAIIHVEDELTLIDGNAKEHVVLNPNVLIEIGAAMALYGKRFILLVKDGVKLPSNLQGLFEVRYQGDSLDGDVTIRLLEAINEMKRAKGVAN